MGIINNKNIIYNNSKTFFWASIFLPKSILNKVINIYSFCRTYDDIVDEGLPITSSQDAKKLEEIIRSYGISQNLIDELISGINSDVNFKRYKNNDELLRYCYKVAGVVGLMMSQALEIRNLEAKYFAIDLGIAMQLTNIARDISQDFDKNRIYLPEDTGISADIISNMTHDNKIKIEKISSKKSNEPLLEIDNNRKIENKISFSEKIGPKPLLLITYRGDSWTEIIDSNGDIVFFDLVKNGNTINFNILAPFEILLGDATVVNIKYNNKEINIPYFNPDTNVGKIKVKN